MGSRENVPPKTKTMRKIAGRWSKVQRPAILPWFLIFGWRPSPRYHGLLARYIQRPDCCWSLRLSMTSLKKTVSNSLDHALAHDRPSGAVYTGFRAIMQKRAQQARVYFKTSSTTNVVLFKQGLVARLIRLLQVVKKRASCRHELQEAAA